MEAQLNSYFDATGYLSPESRNKYLKDRGLIRLQYCCDVCKLYRPAVILNKTEEYKKAQDYISIIINKRKLKSMGNMNIDVDSVQKELESEVNKINKKQITELKEDIYEESNEIDPNDVPF